MESIFLWLPISPLFKQKLNLAFLTQHLSRCLITIGAKINNHLCLFPEMLSWKDSIWGFLLYFLRFLHLAATYPSWLQSLRWPRWHCCTPICTLDSSWQQELAWIHLKINISHLVQRIHITQNNFYTAPWGVISFTRGFPDQTVRILNHNHGHHGSKVCITSGTKLCHKSEKLCCIARLPVLNRQKKNLRVNSTRNSLLGWTLTRYI